MDGAKNSFTDFAEGRADPFLRRQSSTRVFRGQQTAACIRCRSDGPSDNPAGKSKPRIFHPGQRIAVAIAAGFFPRAKRPFFVSFPGVEGLVAAAQAGGVHRYIVIQLLFLSVSAPIGQEALKNLQFGVVRGFCPVANLGDDDEGCLAENNPV